MKLKKALAIACALACLTAAQAALVKISFEGSNSSPDSPYPNVFGQKVLAVSGYAIYEPDTPATLFSTFNGITSNYWNALRGFGFGFGFEVTRKGGTTLCSGSKASDTGFGSAQVSDRNPGQDRFSLNDITLLGQEVDNAPGFFSQAKFTLGLGATNATAIATADRPPSKVPGRACDAGCRPSAACRASRSRSSRARAPANGRRCPEWFRGACRTPEPAGG